MGKCQNELEWIVTHIWISIGRIIECGFVLSQMMIVVDGSRRISIRYCFFRTSSSVWHCVPRECVRANSILGHIYRPCSLLWVKSSLVSFVSRDLGVFDILGNSRSYYSKGFEGVILPLTVSFSYLGTFSIAALRTVYECAHARCNGSSPSFQGWHLPDILFLRNVFVQNLGLIVVSECDAATDRFVFISTFHLF